MAQWVIGNLEHHAKKGGSIVLQVCTIKKNVDRNTIQIELNWIGTFQLKKKKISLQFNWIGKILILQYES